MRLQHVVADAKYYTKRAKDLIWRYLPALHHTVPTYLPDLYSGVTVDLDVAIPMRDGIKLFADIYRPMAKGPFPVVLIRMPYGKREGYCYMPSHGKYWAKKGYVCVIQDVRGKWRSEGEWEPFINEADDGYDTVDWIAKQSWCDGGVGMTGESYYGYTQLAAATTGHPNLKCIVPGDTAANIYGVWVYNSFALAQQTMGIWAPETNSRTYANYNRLDPWYLPLVSADDDAGIPSSYYKEWINRPVRDEYWEKINLDSLYHKITIPILSWGGWYDTFLKGTIDDWAGVRAANARTSMRKQFLMIAGTDHEITPTFTGKIGRLEVDKKSWSNDKILLFFDHFLKGIENEYATKGAVEIFVMGENRWRTENEWPLARTEYTKFYLHSNGAANSGTGNGLLDKAAPQSAEPADEFRYDPFNPVQASYQENMWRRAETLQDRRIVECRADVLCYTTAALVNKVEVSGPLALILYASSSARDTDFTAALVDLYPDGYCHLVQEGIVRARYRDMKRGEQLLEPGKVYKFEIDLWATSYVFKAGHKIRLEISSSNFDRYDRNPNTGDKFGYDSNVVIAEQRVLHDEAHPSHLVLPIIPD